MPYSDDDRGSLKTQINVYVGPPADSSEDDFKKELLD